jgi:hypothetical protein
MQCNSIKKFWSKQTLAHHSGYCLTIRVKVRGVMMKLHQYQVSINPIELVNEVRTSCCLRLVCALDGEVHRSRPKVIVHLMDWPIHKPRGETQ